MPEISRFYGIVVNAENVGRAGLKKITTIKIEGETL